MNPGRLPPFSGPELLAHVPHIIRRKETSPPRQSCCEHRRVAKRRGKISCATTYILSRRHGGGGEAEMGTLAHTSHVAESIRMALRDHTFFPLLPSPSTLSTTVRLARCHLQQSRKDD